MPVYFPSIAGVSASNTVFSSGTVRFTGGPNITAGSDASGVSFSAADPVSAGIGGVAASDTTYTSGTVVFTGTNNVTVQSTTGQKVVISGPSAIVPTLSVWKRHGWGPSVVATTHQSIMFFPLDPQMKPFPGNMTVSSMGLGMSWATAATSVSQQLSSSLCLGLYTLNVDSLSLISSGSVSFGNTNASTKNGSDRWHGIRLLTFAPPNGLSTYSNTPYWMGLMFSSHVTTIAGSVMATQGDAVPNAASIYSGVQGNSATATTNQPLAPFQGFYSAASAALPGSVSRGQINQGTVVNANACHPFLIFNDVFIT